MAYYNYAGLAAASVLIVNSRDLRAFDVAPDRVVPLGGVGGNVFLRVTSQPLVRRNVVSKLTEPIPTIVIQHRTVTFCKSASIGWPDCLSCPRAKLRLYSRRRRYQVFVREWGRQLFINHTFTDAGYPDRHYQAVILATDDNNSDWCMSLSRRDRYQGLRRTVHLFLRFGSVADKIWIQSLRDWRGTKSG